MWICEKIVFMVNSRKNVNSWILEKDTDFEVNSQKKDSEFEVNSRNK